MRSALGSCRSSHVLGSSLGKQWQSLESTTLGKFWKETEVSRVEIRLPQWVVVVAGVLAVEVVGKIGSRVCLKAQHLRFGCQFWKGARGGQVLSLSSGRAE